MPSRLGDNAGMARDPSWAQVLRVALPILDEVRPSGVLEWVPRVVPVVTLAAVGAGHWAAGRRGPAGRRLERHLSRHISRYNAFFRAAGTPQYKLGFTVAGMVIGVWWGLRRPRRLSVLAIAVEAQNAVFRVPWVARAVQRRRLRIAAG